MNWGMNWGVDVLIYGLVCSLWGLGLGFLYGYVQGRRYGLRRIDAGGSE